ncbi:NAD(+)/NADH kinase [Candidatus Bathyarchaeota archaeon]|nr:NAD(+)/NADH kinase [Candidatus Bathyarchaeota archaeon]
MPKRVGVVAKTESREAISMAKRLYQTIVARGMTPVLESQLATSARLGTGTPLKRMIVDLMVTLGGDGTVLKAVREMPRSKTPILAVNLGRSGYLTEIEPEQVEESFGRWIDGDFQLEEQWRVSVSLNGHWIGDCLNEALLLSTTLDKMLNITATQSGKRIIQARTDGFMVATPTGSTAHSFSAGGPVLETSLNVLVMTLIAPLQPVKSLVVPADKKLTVRLEKPGPAATLVNDGNPVQQIRVGQTLEMKRSKDSAFFVRFGDTFLQRSLRRLATERENV